MENTLTTKPTTDDNTLFTKLTIDVIFKAFFTKEETKPLLKTLIADILQEPVEKIGNINIVNAELPSELINEKSPRLDLNLELDGKNIDIEMQVNPTKEHVDRMLFYWSELYTLKKGADYKNLTPTYVISFMTTNLFKSAGYHKSASVRFDDDFKKATDKLSLHFFQMKNLPAEINTNDEMELWLRLMRAETLTELQEISKTGSKIMEQAVNIVTQMNKDNYLQELARHRNSNEMTYEHTIGEAERRGEQKEQQRSIEKLKRMGMSEQQIQQFLAMQLN
jgi:predicted transposase/invertase (TIGR01784 family)